MPSAISCEVVLTSASTRSDGSIGLRFATPELSSQDKAAFFDLINKNLKMLLQPMEESPSGFQEVKSELETKTPSQRLRSILFVQWKQLNNGSDFDSFYKASMNSICESIKSKLEP